MSELKNCCPSTLPPVDSNYTPAGTHITLGGLKTYITGPPTSYRATLLIYDIFGPVPQTLQGADRLATLLSCPVLVPDFLEGKYALEEWLQQEPSQEGKQQLKLFRKFSEPPKMVGSVIEVMRSFETQNGKSDGEINWACLGLCWGGKVTALASAELNTPFKVSGQGHPSNLMLEDAEKITIPHIILAAPTDNKDGGVDAYSNVSRLGGRKWIVETYEGMFHGWMGARADLDNEENAREFERAYEQIAMFFAREL